MAKTEISTENKILEGLYIPSIEATWLYKFNKEINDYKIDNKYLDKLLNGKLDYSFELVMNDQLINNIDIKNINDKYYTLDVVNVKYTKKYKNIINKKVIEEKNIKELRDWSYENGFIFNGNKMSNWKRSGGKARVGENLFLIDKIKDNCLNWARMNLQFEGNVDIGSIRAYESLPLSSIIGTIELNPENILVIDDFKSKFPWKMSKTWLKDGELQTETMEVDECNSIWDGQGLLSSKIFEENEFIKGFGVALLRNRYMKCAGFCCYIDKFFKDYCNKNGFDYETFEIEDMYGNKIKIKDILLITTPSAIKIAKYNNEVLKNKNYFGAGAWLKYWKDNCGSTYGVCKTEKPSHHCEKDEDGNILIYKNVLSYQMLNTIPFTKLELKQLVENEVKYVERLKNDLDFFLQEINKESDFEEMIIDDTNDEVYEDEILEIGSNIDTIQAFTELSKINEKFKDTQVFKDYRRNFINAYIKRLRQGRIRIESDYCIACGNPISMLKATVSEFDETQTELKGNQLYCSRFQEGEEIIGFRNPHINCSNIGIQINHISEDIKKYMNDTPNIVYLNSVRYPILSTYQGEDFDIDCNLLTNNNIIVDACKRIDKEKTAISVNRIENTGKNDAELTAKNMSDVDFKIAQNFIGSTINLSQEINSLMNHLEYGNLASEKEIEELFNKSSRCSSISCCEIDKAKKQFEDLNVPKELDRMKIDLKLVDNKEVVKVKGEIETLKKIYNAKKTEIREYRKDKRKPIYKRIREIKKEMIDNMTKELKNNLFKLEEEISKINSEKENEIYEIKIKINLKNEELKTYDKRRVKPYFFKYIGDNKVLKQRRANIRKHKKSLDYPILEKFCKNNQIDNSKVDLNKKDCIKILRKYCIENKIDFKGLNRDLKENSRLHKEWQEKLYVRIDTPMDWLQAELDGIKNKRGIGTIQVINLIKNPRNKSNLFSVNKVVNLIIQLQKQIDTYRLNEDLIYKDKINKINTVKISVKNKILKLNLNRSDLYDVLKICLNTCKKNGKVDKKSGMENITLEILFKTYGIKFLDMFIKYEDSQIK